MSNSYFTQINPSKPIYNTDRATVGGPLNTSSVFVGDGYSITSASGIRSNSDDQFAQTVGDGSGVSAFADLTGKPTTIGGYGITDGLIKTNNLSDVSSASTSRTNLGLGSLATQNSNSINITGGTISGVSGIVPLNNGNRINSSYLPTNINWTNRSPNPSTLPSGSIRAIAVHPNSGVIAIGTLNPPFIQLYNYSPVSGIGTQLALPSSLPQSGVTSLAWNHKGNYLAYTCNGGNPTLDGQFLLEYIATYSFNGVSLGNKNIPSTPIDTDSDARALAWNSTDTYLAYGCHNANNHIFATFPMSSSGTFGNIIFRNNDVGSTDTDIGNFIDNTNGVVWSKDDNYIIYAYGVDPFVLAFQFTPGSVWPLVANPSVKPTGRSQGICISQDGNYLFLTHQTTPFLTGYLWSGSGFISKIPNPEILPPGNGQSICISNDGTQLIHGSTVSPFISAYPFESGNYGTQLQMPTIPPLAATQTVAITPTTPYGIFTGWLTTAPNLFYYTGRQKPSTPILRSSTANLNMVANNRYIYTGAGTTWTLPNLTGKSTVKNAGTGSLTVKTLGTDTMFFTSSTTSGVLLPGDYREYEDDGTTWQVE